MTNIPCSACNQLNLSNARYCSGCGNQLNKEQIEVEHKPLSTHIEKPRGDKRKLIGLVAGMVVFWTVYYGVQKVFFGPPSFEKALVATANEINKVCPIIIDSSTRLDNTLALPGNTFQYNYTIVDLTKAEVNTDTMKKYLEPALIQNVKTNPDLRIQREHKTTLIYSYKDRNGEQIFKVSVTPEMYQ